MYFKSWLRRLMAAALSFVLVGCGVKIGEKAPEQSPVTYSGRNYSCVSQISQHIQRYINGDLNDQEITEFVRCLQNAFSSFAQYTRGREQNNYAADEIRNFLQKSFIRDRLISDELLHEFMVIKQALVGGDTEHIARSELFEAIDFLEDLRVEAIRLRPHIQILNPRLVGQQDNSDKMLGQRLSQANETLKISIQAIAAHLQKSKKVYPLANLEAFMTEFREFVRWEDHFKNARPVPKWIALLRAFKEIAVSPVEPDIIHESDWVPLLQTMSNWYLAYLQYQVGVRGKPVLSGDGLQNTIFLGHQLFSLTRQAVDSQKPSPVITFEQLNRLTVALHDIGWIPENIRPSSVDTALRALVTRIAGDGVTKPSSRRARGLDRKAISNLEFEFDRWADVQINLDIRFKAETPQPLTPVPNLQTYMPLSLGVRAQLDSLDGSYWDEFAKIKTLMRPLFPENLNRVMLVPEDKFNSVGLRHGFYNLSVMNILRSCVALVFRGYSEGASTRWLWNTGIKSPEMQKFYIDFRDLGIDLALVDKRNSNSGSRAFVEGKLFTFSSTGLNYDPANPDAGELSFVEAMEYFAYLYSGGEMAKDIYVALASQCENGPVDINGLPKISRACALREMPTMINRLMPNLPNLQAYVAKVPAQERLAYSQTLLDTAFSPASDNRWVEKNEISTLAVVIHYAESVMTRFDRNQDGLLENEELEAAVPMFTGFIRKIGKEKKNQNYSPAEARAAFFFILNYKKLPETKIDAGLVYAYEWREPALSLDRSQLAGVFKAIIARLFEVGKKPAVQPPPAVAPAGTCHGFESFPEPGCKGDVQPVVSGFTTR